MNLKLNILNVFFRRTLCIALILLVGISFSAGGALAKGCQGGAGCLNCAAAAHPHIPGMDADMANQGCQPSDQNRSCGFEVGHRADEFDSMVSMAGFGNYPQAGIFIAAYDKFDQAHLRRVLIARFQYPDPGELTPIYLLNNSLLC